MQQRSHDVLRHRSQNDRKMGLRLADLQALRIKENPLRELTKPQHKMTQDRTDSEFTLEQVQSGRVPTRSRQNMLMDIKMKDRYRLVNDKVCQSDDRLPKRGIASVSKIDALPDIQSKFSIFQSSAIKATDKSELPSNNIRLSNDSCLPQLQTQTSLPDDSEVKKQNIKFNSKRQEKLGNFLKRQRNGHRMGKEVIMRMGYYLHKLNLHSKYGHTVVKGDYSDHFQKTYNDLRKLENDKIVIDYQLKIVSLPKSRHDQVLVLDLDETLVHCCNFDNKVCKDTVSIALKTQFVKGILKFNIRPGVDQFLRKMADHYQIVVFTASDKEYAKAIVQHIDPNQYICKLLARDSCSFTRTGHLVKDLRIIQDRDISRMVLVDNSTKCSVPQLDNAVPILSFIDDPDDRELEDLSQFLVDLSRRSDMSGYLKSYFQIHRYASSASHLQLLDDIVKTFA